MGKVYSIRRIKNDNEIDSFAENEYGIKITGNAILIHRGSVQTLVEAIYPLSSFYLQLKED